MIPIQEPASFNWRALSGFPDLLVRRSLSAVRSGPHSQDRDEWVIAVSRGIGKACNMPVDSGAWSGHLGFGYTEAVDHVSSRFPSDRWPEARWWRPEVMIRGALAAPEVVQDDGHGGAAELLKNLHLPLEAVRMHSAQWERRTPKERYLAHVKKLLAHIQRGDVYEVNFCTERIATLPGLDPFTAFDRLLQRTDAPHAGLYRCGNLFAFCMSPEHFLRVEGRQVVTRPMKGTRRRSTDPEADAALAFDLARDPKERSENIMAVDVARHDLSRVAAARTVRVEELCAVKSYPRVHQMVSTVHAELRKGLGPWDAVRAAFPMASMTGAPKRRAIQLIDETEDMPRGLFSGSLGYQLPNGTLDLNVVIRTITYDASTGQASLITGSAITAQSDPEQEWEECELKARSVLDALT